MTKFFSSDHMSVVGYVTSYNVHVVGSEPVAPASYLRAATLNFLHTHRNCCFFGASKFFADQFKELQTSSSICIGSQPCWELKHWEETVLAVQSNREQFRRARAKGITIRELSKHEIETNNQLRQVLKVWLEHRRFSPLHFLVESNTLDFVHDRRVFIAERDGQILAWLNLCPVPKRNGWLTEQFPRLPNAPNGTVDLLLHTAAKKLADEGFHFLTMGLVPLSTESIKQKKPLWLQGIFIWTKIHGNRFYNFDGLEKFKSKFRPHSWEPLYAVVPEPRFRPIHLLAIARAFTQEPLLPTLLKGAIRSISQELKWLKMPR